MEFPLPRLKGFAIELPLFRYSVNVQDGEKQVIPGAQVKVTGVNFAQSGLTNNEGCFFGSAELYKTYTMYVLKAGYVLWTHRFLIAHRSNLTVPGANFPIIVRNSAGTPVPGATVTIVSTLPHTNSGTTDSNGAYQGHIEADYTNTITVTAPGYQAYTNIFTHYAQVKCIDRATVAVPIITLTV